MHYRMSALLLLLACMFAPCAGPLNAADSYTNSIGMKLVHIEPGTFLMGQEGDEKQCDWDEQPVHKVTISKPFYMTETEVTVEQFRQFRPDFASDEKYGPYAAGVSWYDAVAFCKWLSDKEDRPYRLPTEAEWEYACRAGTQTPFSSGGDRPGPDTPNAWGLKNMHTGVREWCLDWYGEYPLADQADPVGPEHGITRVIRGGGMDSDDAIFARSANRASIAPSFAPYPDSPAEAGYHPVGFRVVQAPMPLTRPLVYEPPFVRQCVRQSTTQQAKSQPKPNVPYFRKRYLLPTPPENVSREAIDAAGLHPSFRRHNHSPAIEVCPNGDVLMIIYTSYSEYEPGVSLMATRLRFGADQWDMPTPMFDFVDLNDHAPLLWNDKGVIHLFWGNPRFGTGSAFPFQWTSSTDNGATWSEVKFPRFTNEVGCHSKQPINTALRDLQGTMYVASDDCGGRSVLWASKDNGRTWYDTEGRSGGRHTAYALLNDGSILGMGGKNTDIDGFMPKSISRDGGRTWEVTKTPFAAQGSNQRPCVQRLASGRLLFDGDFQRIDGRQPEGITERGSYVALSQDEGQAWHIKKLVGTQQHENPRRHNGADTLGYSAARQAPDGTIHLITTMNRPCLHFAFNEAWILDEGTGEKPDEELMKPSAKAVSKVKEYTEKYPNGKLKATWRAGVGDDGRYLLHGTETWYYQNGHKQWEVTHRLGEKVGVETHWAPDGTKKWQWNHRDDGSSVWTQWWSNGQKKSEGTWRNLKCDGTVTRWDPSGKMISRTKFVNGEKSD